MPKLHCLGRKATADYAIAAKGRLGGFIINPRDPGGSSLVGLCNQVGQGPES